MFSAFNTFGKLGAIGKAIASAWSPLSLWPNGIDSPGMWISPRDLTSEWQDYTGTTPVVEPGTVADSANPVGLALDIRAGATVLTDPGLHMLQSTSVDRPLLSARVNLLTNTEDFSAVDWAPAAMGFTASVVAPDGTSTAQTLIPSAANTAHTILQSTICEQGPYIYQVYLKAAGYSVCGMTMSDGATAAIPVNVDLSAVTVSAAVAAGAWTNAESTISDAGNGWRLVTLRGTRGANTDMSLVFHPGTTAGASFAGDGVSGVSFWHPQLEHGSVATTYQPVVSASDYDSTGFPIAQLYNGTNSSMATAAFAAGTLINGMDCMIPVRRDSAASCVAGLYNGVADATKFFGMAESASGSGCVGSGAGTPTVWVDNTQLTGGTAVTRGTLHTALTGGDWHILEFRNLDLSTWTAAGFGLYTSYLFPGLRGDIMLYPSTASTEDKDAARQWLADYYGVTLP